MSATLSIVTLAGLLSAQHWLASLSTDPSAITTKANTAVVLLMGAIALLIGTIRDPSRPASRIGWRAIGVAMLLVTTLTLAEYALSIDLGLDALLLGDGGGGDRMAPNTALALSLLGVAVLLLDVETRRGRRPSELLGLAAAAVSLVALLGYAYESPLAYALPPFTGMSVPTALSITLLGVAVVFARPSAGIVRIFGSGTAGGRSARFMLPLAVLVPPLLALMIFLGVRRGLYDELFGLTILVSLVVIVLAAGAWANALQLERREVEREGLIERLRHETRELDLERSRLQSVIDVLPVGLFICDAHGEPTRVNPAARAMWGGSVPLSNERAEYGRYKAWWPDGRPVAAEEWGVARSLTYGETCREQELRIEAFDGTQRTILNSTAPIRDAGNTIVGAVAVNVDITERKKIEQALRESTHTLETRVRERTASLETALARLGESEERFRLMVESARDYAIIMLDADGRISTWNRGAERLMGWRADEVVGKDISVLYPPDAIAAAPPRELVRTALRDGRSEAEAWHVRKDGSRFWADVVLRPVYDESKELRGFVKVTRDVSERRRAEEELRDLARRLEETLRHRTAVAEELEAFAYSVSHDLRAPLRWLDGFSSELEEDHAANLNAEGRECVRNIRESVQRMAQLIDDLLRLSRVTSGEIRHDPVDLAALARTIVNRLRRESPLREVEVVMPENVCAIGDESLLRQALENLLDNAWKFTQRTRGRIELGAETRDGRSIYYVRDNGVGFDIANAERLFRPFERLHRATEFEGTGIGLAIVKRIVRRHGGDIWVRSEVDRGTTFFFTLGEVPNGERD